MVPGGDRRKLKSKVKSIRMPKHIASIKFASMESGNGGKTWRGYTVFKGKKLSCSTHPTEEIAAVAVDK